MPIGPLLGVIMTQAALNNIKASGRGGKRRPKRKRKTKARKTKRKVRRVRRRRVRTPPRTKSGRFRKRKTGGRKRKARKTKSRKRRRPVDAWAKKNPKLAKMVGKKFTFNVSVPASMLRKR